MHMPFNPNMPRQPNMNQPFQQGPLNHAMGGGQAYNPGRGGGRPIQQSPYMHPATKPPAPPPVPHGHAGQAGQAPQGKPNSPFGQRSTPPLPQGNPVPPTVETTNNIQSPIALEKINNFSGYLRGLRNPPQVQNYPDINVFGTYF